MMILLIFLMAFVFFMFAIDAAKLRHDFALCVLFCAFGPKKNQWSGKREVVRTLNVESAVASTSSADAPGMLSIIFIAFSEGIAMQAVASASAVMHSSAITVALKVLVCAGWPVAGSMVCHVRPALVS
jgi:hypothetical protein